MGANSQDTITKSDVIRVFKEFVTDYVNSQLVWGSDNIPFTEFVFSDDTDWGGTSGGIPFSTLTNAEFDVASDTITASDIFDILVDETANYTNLRYINAILFVSGSGGNTGTRLTPGTVFNETRLAHLDSSYKTTVDADQFLYGEDIISASGLDEQFQEMKSAWMTVAFGEEIQTHQVTVCHSSCHSSCHGSRGRR